MSQRRINNANTIIQGGFSFAKISLNLNLIDPANYVNQMVATSGKISLLRQMLSKLKKNGHKVLIFSQMTRMLDILQDFLEYEGYDYCRIDGSTKQSDRQERVNKIGLNVSHFQIALFNSDDSLFVFLLSTRAGGLGINLTSADTVIIYDSDWNPQVDLQAQDRCHRIGQTRPVCVFRLVMANSVEGKILNVANKKLKMERLVIQHGNKVIFSIPDMEFIF